VTKVIYVLAASNIEEYFTAIGHTDGLRTLSLVRGLDPDTIADILWLHGTTSADLQSAKASSR
jgi:hypothetical protein